MFSIYIHIPFCVQKCRYCDFLSFCAGEEDYSAYINALLTEIRRESGNYSDRQADTVFIGGGTPSVLPLGLLEQLLEQLHASFQISSCAEISMEMNPGTVSKDSLQAYHRMGINRLSIGLQSARDEELRLLGRIHTWQQFQTCYEQARTVGFWNVNIDVMSALPGQTMETCMDTLKKVCDLEPEHISAYSLIIEEGTPFYETYRDGCGLPEEEEERKMYAHTKQLLGERGYGRYEISNYSRKGYECRHNIAYWKGTDYVGLGLGAASMCNHVRWSNTAEWKKYLLQTPEDNVKEQLQSLTLREQMEEYMFLGLRMMEGISVSAFERRFDVPFRHVYGEVIRKLKQDGLIWGQADTLRLTDYGIDISNYVFEKFLL